MSEDSVNYGLKMFPKTIALALKIQTSFPPCHSVSSRTAWWRHVHHLDSCRQWVCIREHVQTLVTWQRDESYVGVGICRDWKQWSLWQQWAGPNWPRYKTTSAEPQSSAASWMKSWGQPQAMRSMFYYASNIQRIKPSIHHIPFICLSIYPLNDNFALSVKHGPENTDPYVFSVVCIGSRDPYVRALGH